MAEVKKWLALHGHYDLHELTFEELKHLGEDINVRFPLVDYVLERQKKLNKKINKTKT